MTKGILFHKSDLWNNIPCLFHRKVQPMKNVLLWIALRRYGKSCKTTKWLQRGESPTKSKKEGPFNI